MFKFNLDSGRKTLLTCFIIWIPIAIIVIIGAPLLIFANNKAMLVFGCLFISISVLLFFFSLACIIFGGIVSHSERISKSIEREINISIQEISDKSKSKKTQSKSKTTRSKDNEEDWDKDWDEE